MSLCISYYQFVAAYDRYVEYEHQIPPKFSKEFPSKFFIFFFLRPQLTVNSYCSYYLTAHFSLKIFLFKYHK